MSKPSFEDAFKENVTIEQQMNDGTWPPLHLPSVGLIPYIRRLKRSNGQIKGIEIGTGRGESTCHIMQECPEVDVLYTIDPYIPYSDWVKTFDQAHCDEVEAIAKQNIFAFNLFNTPALSEKPVREIIMIKEKSKDTVLKFANDTIDFVILDGLQQKEEVARDLRLYYKKVKPGGLFAGTNYRLNTVRDAIKEWRLENKVSPTINITHNNVWFWHKPRS